MDELDEILIAVVVAGAAQGVASVGLNAQVECANDAHQMVYCMMMQLNYVIEQHSCGLYMSDLFSSVESCRFVC